MTRRARRLLLCIIAAPFAALVILWLAGNRDDELGVIGYVLRGVLLFVPRLLAGVLEMVRIARGDW